jgi:recombination protein RecA
MLKEIEKKYGNVLFDGKSIIDNPCMVIPLSPRLDIALGGGILEGSFFILTGHPKCGKTTTALSFAATCQKEQYGGRFIYYLNIEGRLKERDLKGIAGLDLDRFKFVASTQGNILNASQYLDIAEKIIHECPNSVIIIDSFSALCTEAEMTGGMDEMQRADGPKVISKFLRKVGNVVPVNKNIVIGITHLMGNPSGKGKAYKEKSGQTLAYQADTKIYANYVKPLDSGEKQVGQEVEWEVVTSAIGPPGQKTNCYIRYGEGIDYELELLKIADDLNFVTKKGSWYEFADGSKAQGDEKARELIRTNAEIKDALIQNIKELYNG